VDDIMNIENMHTILFEGYYTQDEEQWDTLLPHTDETFELYMRGLEACGGIGDDDMYEGVVFENGKSYAQLDRAGEIEYIEL
jgi:hypothetical protein